MTLSYISTIRVEGWACLDLHVTTFRRRLTPAMYSPNTAYITHCKCFGFSPYNVQVLRKLQFFSLLLPTTKAYIAKPENQHLRCLCYERSTVRAIDRSRSASDGSVVCSTIDRSRKDRPIAQRHRRINYSCSIDRFAQSTDCATLFSASLMMQAN